MFEALMGICGGTASCRVQPADDDLHWSHFLASGLAHEKSASIVTPASLKPPGEKAAVQLLRLDIEKNVEESEECAR